MSAVAAELPLAGRWISGRIRMTLRNPRALVFTFAFPLILVVMPVAQLTFLPISFISGIWFPLDGAPDWLVNIAHFFPLYHIVDAFGSCFVPGTTGSGFNASDMGAILGWTAVGLFVAVRRFRWEP